LHFITIGHKLASHEKAWTDDFLKRLSKFTPTSHKLVKDKWDLYQNLDDPKYIKWCQDLIPKQTFLIVLDTQGARLDTQDWTDKLFHIRETYKHITFLIGGAFGLPQPIKSKASLLMSLSAMTLPHRLAYLLLLEQTYRAFTIHNNMPYHH